MYDLCETIGEGHYAVVKLAKHVFTGETVAIKVIDKMKMDSATWMQMLQAWLFPFEISHLLSDNFTYIV